MSAGSAPAPVTISMDAAQPGSESGSGFKRLQLIIAVTLMVLGIGTWLLDKAGVLPADVGGRHGMTVAILGFMLLPSGKKKRDNKPTEEEDSQELMELEQLEQQQDETERDQTRER